MGVELELIKFVLLYLVLFPIIQNLKKKKNNVRFKKKLYKVSTTKFPLFAFDATGGV